MFVVSPRIIVINEAGRGMRPEGTSTRDWDFDPRHVPSLITCHGGNWILDYDYKTEQTTQGLEKDKYAHLNLNL